MEIKNIRDSPGYLIESLSRNMRRYSAHQLRKNKVDLTLEQIAVLSILNEYGSKFQNELADLMSKDNPTLTRILDLLEKKSYVKRELSQGDRRKFLIVLTKKGSTKLSKILPIVQQIRTSLFYNITEEQIHQFKELKHLIEANIADINP